MFPTVSNNITQYYYLFRKKCIFVSQSLIQVGNAKHHPSFIAKFLCNGICHARIVIKSHEGWNTVYFNSNNYFLNSDSISDIILEHLKLASWSFSFGRFSFLFVLIEFQAFSVNCGRSLIGKLYSVFCFAKTYPSAFGLINF